MTIEKQLKDIGENDLNRLITSLVKEGKDIEFKRELNVAASEAKRKFLRGVAAFANTLGGHVIFGMEAKDGVATSLCALLNFNEDSEIIRLRDLIRAHIEPKVFGFDFRAVALSGGGQALVLWVPRGWAGPHMVTFENDNRFYCRQSNGAALMDVGEVRTAFAAAESLPEKVRRLRLDRLSAIVSGDVPRPLCNHAALVLHLIPVKSLDTLHEFDLEKFTVLEQVERKYLATTFESERRGDLEFDFDAVFRMVAHEEKCYAYTKLFRTGVMEVVDSLSLEVEPRRGSGFLTAAYERPLFEFFPRWLETLRVARIEAPLFVGLSFIGMGQRFPYLDLIAHNAIAQPRSIRHDPLLIRASSLSDLKSNN